MASVAAPFVSVVPGPSSLLVPISWLLARWPLRSTLRCQTEKIRETPVPASNSLFCHPVSSFSSPLLTELLPLTQDRSHQEVGGGPSTTVPLASRATPGL
ncbi:unnamed protein product [Pleuronectes platessa]|uniref:Uncharacterized protein n=1 Tax=Pleuronectes platessa TaxID=8262 RepID=A0A9N7UF77_PLEPL|nr:unnamed protein product [Pleuronectes platessa]